MTHRADVSSFEHHRSARDVQAEVNPGASLQYAKHNQVAHRARKARWLATAHGIIYVATGIWPVLHMSSFLIVTGPKTDLWLVEAFGLLVCAIGVVMLYAAVAQRVEPTLMLVGLAVAATLAFVDAFYVWRGDISKIYLLDGALELLLAIGWAFLLWTARRTHST